MMKGLYIHIPFCDSICTYCDFPKQIAKESKKEVYIEHLLAELEEKRHLLTDITSVYIGGGTPNSLCLELLEKLLKAISSILDNSIENTIEINAELLTLDQVLLFKKYNINRISIGVQTIVPDIIKIINRHHNKEMIINAIQMLRKNHIQNINLDMMFGLPNQTMANLKEDLLFILNQPITHISYYSLIKEEKTILEYQLKHNQISIPDDDLVADMYEFVNQNLKMSMFNHYEISNYSLDGYQSLHNLLYWNCDDYIGIGASAASLLGEKRFQNALSLTKYYSKVLEEDTILSTYERKQEYMMLGLRKIAGVSINKYYDRFNSNPSDDFNLDKLVSFGLIDINNDTISIKKDKLLLANLVFEEFVG